MLRGTEDDQRKHQEEEEQRGRIGTILSPLQESRKKTQGSKKRRSLGLEAPVREGPNKERAGRLRWVRYLNNPGKLDEATSSPAYARVDPEGDQATAVTQPPHENWW